MMLTPELLCLCTVALHLAHAFSFPPSFGARGPASAGGRAAESSDPGCEHVGGTCALGGLYPARPDLVFSAIFNVPPLPATFTSAQTYYNYFNVYFGNHRPPGGRYNQFVPQLMLGSVLAGSTGYPDYKPVFMPLKTWHFGAQYFMAFNEKGHDSEPYRSAAVTGALIPVEAGEQIMTTIALSADGETWTLRMFVVGGGPERESIVVATKPFMGLLNTTKSWREYTEALVGSCWENYKMLNQTMFPPGWSHQVTIAGPTVGNWWRNWTVRAKPASCPWAPKSKIHTSLSASNTSQLVDWEIVLPTGVHEEKQRYSDLSLYY